jgi:membrane peptidoglycan carboxypeptidase
VVILFVCAAVAGAGAWALSIELQAATVQSRLLSRLTSEFGFAVEPGPSPSIRFPGDGPYDRRLGYAHLPVAIQSLEGHGYVINNQARVSPALAAFIDYGGFPIFQEKSQAGLRIRDRTGADVHVSRYPERVFTSFDAVPPLVIDTLLFVENRELLDERFPTLNPAVEWDRFAAATVNVVSDQFDVGSRRFGGSTLATQIEKYRHSPEGRTGSVTEKLRQIATASVRAYQDGPDTTLSRKQIVVDYLNSTPLSARPGYGEIIGLGDGLWAWFGSDLGAVNRLLGRPPRDDGEREQRATIYRQVLSLLIAQRRPSHYLLQGREDLAELVDSHLRLLAFEGTIDPQFRDDALAARVVFRSDLPAGAMPSFIDQKAVNGVRAQLLSMVRVNGFYDLDRLDLSVDTTIDSKTQNAVIEILRRLTDPKQAAALGLTGERLLRPNEAPGILYSITLYERGQHANYVRVQADNLDRPLDLNEGGKLDLGSTAKLRTLVSYLEIIAELHQRYGELSKPELQEAAKDAADPLSRWAIDYLIESRDRGMQVMLDAAMARRYSASVGEWFFTGRGMHSFANFDKQHSKRVMTVWDAFRYSVNLPFIRMMRDIVRYHLADGAEPAIDILTDPTHPARRDYLERFADMEGSQYIGRFYRRYAGKTPDETLSLVAKRTRPVPHRLATVFRSVRPDASFEEFSSFLRQSLPKEPLDRPALVKLFNGYGPERFNLHDRGYIARIHPLELWLVSYLQGQPQAARRDVLEASTSVRQEAYAWLFKSKRASAASNKIRIMLEDEAFDRIHASWQRLGYPFPNLVPSYATAIGSSADRPQALAELVGMILNDGVRMPSIRITGLHFAQSTPYETHMLPAADQAVRLMPAEVAATLRRAMINVVEGGTARRIAGVFVDGVGKRLPIGGKTGTGDELADQAAALRSREVSRSAAFVFFIGERFFGTVTAHVPGPFSKQYRFTSALPTQVLKVVSPALQPMVAAATGRPPPAEQFVATVAPVAATR